MQDRLLPLRFYVFLIDRCWDRVSRIAAYVCYHSRMSSKISATDECRHPFVYRVFIGRQIKSAAFALREIFKAEL
jgi:hypothetical protein